MAEVLTVREYVSITNNAIGETLATEVLRRRGGACASNNASARPYVLQGAAAD